MQFIQNLCGGLPVEVYDLMYRVGTEDFMSLFCDSDEGSIQGKSYKYLTSRQRRLYNHPRLLMVWNHLGRAGSLNVLGVRPPENQRLTTEISSRGIDLIGGCVNQDAREVKRFSVKPSKLSFFRNTFLQFGKIFFPKLAHRFSAIEKSCNCLILIRFLYGDQLVECFLHKKICYINESAFN